MRNIDDIIYLIAKKNGVSPQEIKKEMQKSITDAFYSSSLSKENDELWNAIVDPCKEPTIEDFLLYISFIINLSAYWPLIVYEYNICSLFRFCDNISF